MKKKIRTYSGTTSPEASPRELEARTLARQAAAEGMVLLKNDGMLPLKPGIRVALFGSGAVRTVKGGTGSGDVNERETVGIRRGLQDAGLVLTNEDWLEDFEQNYRQARLRWRDELMEGFRNSAGDRFFAYYSSHPFRMPQGRPMREEDFDGAEAGIYVVGRNAGEDADRFCAPGDYELTDTEKQELTFLSDHCRDVAVVINTGGQIDLKFILSLPNLRALMVISQPGMEGGHAFADVITGRVTPGGKLTDTWAVNYGDFPNSATFSHNNGDVQTERYTEGQYVGYRYFDSFGVAPAFPFGFGLSYTEFSVEPRSVTAAGNSVTAQVTVRNTGSTFSGREVVQLYVSCPQTELPKVYQKLAGFAKTDLLAPGESQTLRIRFDARDIASYDENRACWLAEAGKYGIRIGNSSASAALCAVLEVPETVVLEQVKNICPLQEPLDELTCPNRREQEQAWLRQAAEENLPVIPFTPRQNPEESPAPCAAAEQAAAITEQLTRDQLIAMVIGEINKGQGSELGSAGIMVPGAAGETSGALEADFDIPGISMADGPAGLRLVKSYEVDRASGAIVSQGMLDALEGGLFALSEDHENTDRYYQYATAFPVGTLLAQSWDPELVTRVGRAVAREMQEFGVSWWLAPGMNIHRNPLCGRNFEYYSEDPLVSGRMAAAITRGVQSVPGVGTTIKHFACNNQEDNRYGSNSVLSERVLREIYLRGFEIAVREAQPMCIMTSYNLINGIHAANNGDLCTQAARREWGFRGIIMTDWTTTFPRGGSSSWKCIACGNDLIMPGYAGDIENINAALDSGELTPEALKSCVRRMLTVILQTQAFEDAVPYGG